MYIYDASTDDSEWTKTTAHRRDIHTDINQYVGCDWVPAAHAVLNWSHATLDKCAIPANTVHVSHSQ